MCNIQEHMQVNERSNTTGDRELFPRGSTPTLGGSGSLREQDLSFPGARGYARDIGGAGSS